MRPLRYTDDVDGSLAALARTPHRFLEAEVRQQTSFVEWAERHEPAEYTAGLDRLRADLDAGRWPRPEAESVRAEIGDATLLVWRAQG